DPRPGDVHRGVGALVGQEGAILGRKAFVVTHGETSESASGSRSGERSAAAARPVATRASRTSADTRASQRLEMWPPSNQRIFGCCQWSQSGWTSAGGAS